MTGWPIMILPDVSFGLCRGDVLTESRPSDLDGLALPGFLVERVLGVGGMGIVVAARELSTGRVFALKTLRAAFARDRGAVARFEREARFSMRIVHPKVPRVYGIGRLEDGRPCYWMELVRGRTVGQIVREDGPLPVDAAVDIVLRVLSALEAVHAAGIVHRDVTPENVLVTSGPRGEPRVLLLDLGFAHEPGVDTGDGLTEESRGALVGTASFMAPEQVMRARAITPQTDLFATGLLLYYAISGKLPFRGADAEDAVVSMLRRQPAPLRSTRGRVPRALDVFLSRALAKHPDARFASAAEMRSALLRLDLGLAQPDVPQAALAG